MNDMWNIPWRVTTTYPVAEKARAPDGALRAKRGATREEEIRAVERSPEEALKRWRLVAAAAEDMLKSEEKESWKINGKRWGKNSYFFIAAWYIPIRCFRLHPMRSPLYLSTDIPYYYYQHTAYYYTHSCFFIQCVVYLLSLTWSLTLSLWLLYLSLSSFSAWVFTIWRIKRSISSPFVVIISFYLISGCIHSLLNARFSPLLLLLWWQLPHPIDNVPPE